MLARIARHGPVRFDEVMQAALYDGEAGFYATVGQAGRRGDFLTSPEVGPLFGAVLARALDAWWEEAGSPHPFVVVEAGAGSGTFARAVLHAQPRCREALRYVLVEQSARLRAAPGGRAAARRCRSTRSPRAPGRTRRKSRRPRPHPRGQSR